ncbi:hypothetical protein B0A58_12240 [Flavobacterium branchiophilum NBRC 15030 = ATCC 35035]|nr:hypothetical protein B0A58_12240 [Flavobacterium branchiophilum NBRC 15030 = ATCC 35035]
MSIHKRRIRIQIAITSQIQDVTIMDKPDFEKLHLINQLDENDKTTLFKIVDTMLTKKKFKDFFAKNAAPL